MVKSFMEWTTAVARGGGGHVTNTLDLRTGKPELAVKPSWRDARNLSPSRKKIAKEREKTPYWSQGGIT
jgi:hypothetical protein